jgi:3-hydroxybutyrate dehydrogenase
MSVAGKHALVTGGAQGIGLAIATLLARHGARISIMSRNVMLSEAQRSRGTGEFFRTKGDVTDEDQVRRAFSECREAYGPIAILVNNAGIAESATLTRTSLELWERTIATNLTGTFLCMREALQDMIAEKWGRIVNVASIAGLVGAPYIAAYCASKHGVVGLTRAAAAEFDGTGIAVNCVCPGYTETAILHRAIANITAKTAKSEQETRELLARDNPESRIATAEEVAQGILHLIEGSRTGIALVIPGFTEA